MTAEEMFAPEYERVWNYLLRHPQASAEDVALNCDVPMSYARQQVGRISTPKEVLAVQTNEPYEPVDPERIRLLKRGIELTGGDRNQTYGDPWDNLTACATMWEGYLEAKFNLSLNLTAEDVAHMMQLVKMTRTFHGRYHADNYLDNAVYGAIAGECRQVEERVE